MTRRQSLKPRRGAAVMLVLVLLMLLLALAVPFVFIMAQQEGTSTGSINTEQARNLARAGTDHAMGRLNKGNRLNEYARWYALAPGNVSTGATPPRWLPPEYDNPYVDGVLESNIDIATELYGQQASDDLYGGLRDARGNKIFNVEDSLAQVLGVNVRDESGKVNLNAATADLIGNLLGSGVVTEEAIPNGGLYEYLRLDDASWAGDPEERPGAGGAFGGGFVVVDGVLLSYDYRRGNTLYSLAVDPNYPGITGGAALFRASGTGWTIPVGATATSVQAYKLAYYSVLASPDGQSLASFNNLGETRQIARWEWMPRSRYTNYLEGLNPTQYQVLLQDATTVAPTLRFDGRWFYAHVVQSASIQPEGETGKTSNVVQLNFENVVQPDFYTQFDPRSPFKNQPSNVARGIGVGHVVRLRHHNGSVTLGVTIRGNRNGIVSVMTPAPVNYTSNEPVVLEVAERASININTASWPVLVACFKGLRERGQASASGIPLLTAQRLATAVLQRTVFNPARPADYQPFRDLNDLSSFLQGLIFDPNDSSGTRFLQQSEMDAIVFLQRYPYAPQPVSTAPFCYESLDAYAIESLASRFAPSGARVAQSRAKDWVLIGSDASRRYHWRLWDQLAAEQRSPQGNILTLYPAGMENDRNIGVIELPFVHYANSERWIRGRFAPPFNNRPMDIAALAPDNANPAEDFFTNLNNNRGDLLPGAFSFWYRPQYAPGLSTHYLFDAAEQDYSNRISMLWWGDRQRGYKLANRNNGLVFRIKDRTLEAAYTELRYELDPGMFRQGEWYHMQLNWKGTELSQIELLMDGDSRAGSTANPALQPVTPVTNHTFMAPNGAWVSRTTTLMDDLEWVDFVNNPSTSPQVTFDLRIDPQDHGAMPSFGVIRIGDEAIEYSGKDTYQLLMGIRRGARGTTNRFHPRGSKVTVWGYTHAMGDWTRPQSSPVALVPQFPYLPATTGQLQSSVGGQQIWRVSKPGTSNAAYEYPVYMGPDSGFPGADSPALANVLPLQTTAGMPERGLVAVIGFAWDRYKTGGPTGKLYPDFEPPPPAGRDAADNLELPPGRPTFQDLEMEYVYYNGISAGGLNVVARYDDQFQPKQPGQYLHFMGEYNPATIGWGNNPPNPQNVRDNLIQFFALGSAVVLLSLDVTSTGGYHDVSYVQVDDEWFFYNRRFPGQNQGDPAVPLLAFVDTQPVKNAQGGWAPQNSVAQYVQGLAAANNQTPTAFNMFRAQVGTVMANHAAPTPVPPVFVTYRQPNAGAVAEPPTGRGDVVTLIRGVNSDKELHTIRQHRSVFWDHDNNAQTPALRVWLAALVNHTTHDYRRQDPTSICKFPTGELPVELPTTWTFANADPRTADAGGSGGATRLGPHTADFDSFEFRSYAKGLFRIEMPLTDTQPGEGQDIQVNGINGLPQNVGIIHVDDELIAYRGTDTRQTQQTIYVNGQPQIITVTTYWITDITRGVLGSLPAAHAAGSGIMNMASLRLARPANGTTWQPRDSRLLVLPGEQVLRDFGFVRIYEGQNYEVVGYQKYFPPASTQTMGQIIAGRYDPQLFQGPLRGAYGTQARTFSARALVLDQPVRFPDWSPTFCEQGAGQFQRGPGDANAGLPWAQSPEVSHMQGAATFRNALFEDIRWRVSFTPHANMLLHSDAVVARLVVRFDGEGDWGSVPTNRPGGLYSFDFNFNGVSTVDLGGGVYEQTDTFTRPNVPRQRHDRIEWRVYFMFLPNAFERENYKISLQFHGCDIGLRQISRVFRHEEQR